MLSVLMALTFLNCRKTIYYCMEAVSQMALADQRDKTCDLSQIHFVNQQSNEKSSVLFLKTLDQCFQVSARQSLP